MSETTSTFELNGQMESREVTVSDAMLAVEAALSAVREQRRVLARVVSLADELDRQGQHAVAALIKGAARVQDGH